MSFEELLKQAGLGDYSQYFSQDPTKISSALGLEGKQATQFGQFFKPFGEKQFMAAQAEIGEREATRTGFLERDYSSGLEQLQSQYQTASTGLGQQLGQATSQIGQAAGQAGFSGSGATAKQIAESRKVAGQSLQDIMQRRSSQLSSMGLERERGLYGIEQQRGTEMAGLTGTLQNYLQGIFGRGERLYGLDPTDGTTNYNNYTPPTTGDPGGTNKTRDAAGNVISNPMANYLT